VQTREEGGFFRVWTFALFYAKKISEFLKFMVRPHGQEGSSQCGYFDVFYGRPLISNTLLFSTIVYIPVMSWLKKLFFNTKKF